MSTKPAAAVKPDDETVVEVIQDPSALESLETPALQIDLETGDFTEPVPVEAPPAEPIVEAPVEEEVAEELAPPVQRDPSTDVRLTQLEAGLLRKQLDEGLAQVKKSVTDIQAKVVETKAKLHKAIEAGNTAEQVELADTLADQKADLKIATYRSDRVEQDIKKQLEQPAPRQEAPTPPKAKGWMSTNKAWFQKPGFENLTAYTLMVDRQVASEGFDPNTDAYYAEVDKRTKPVRDALVKKPPAPRVPPPPLAPATPSPTPAPTRRSITLTKSDISDMERVGLDPKNKLHLKRFAEAKVDSEAQAAAANQ